VPVALMVSPQGKQRRFNWWALNQHHANLLGSKCVSIPLSSALGCRLW